ncbi:integrase core domain-containing protein [Sagittula salina]|uniref:Integrase core domain-containing protein n=1 Tax=Sagittula salina TaxID=2820268 RepID=A0A940MS68_9RHOB|nr:integrase core domain-containing protein [Sagittula salina]
MVRSYGLKQALITPHCPQQNGMVERLIRTLKEQRVHRHRFESIQHALRVIADCPLVTLLRNALPGDRSPSTAIAALIRPCHAHACRGIQICGLT